MNNMKTSRSHGLLAAGDLPPTIAHNRGAGAAYLVVCDHAGREVPAPLGRLGLPDSVFELHVAWDIGAAAVSDELGERLGASVIRQRYSRLVIDCNREPQRADAIPEVSDRIPIPGNQALPPEGRAARIAEIHAPYHAAIGEEVASQPQLKALILVHSFTPAMQGVARPWTCGVLHHGGSPLSLAMLERLRGEPGQVVGDNQPYAFDSIDYTAPRHALANGIDYLELELRQDLIAESPGQTEWAERLARLIPLAAADCGLV